MPEQKPSYMQEADAWLTDILAFQDGESDEQWLTRVKTAIKQKLLESYRNGQAARPSQASALQTHSQIKNRVLAKTSCVPRK